jgi:hypothetical protein
MMSWWLVLAGFLMGVATPALLLVYTNPYAAYPVLAVGLGLMIYRFYVSPESVGKGISD